MTELERGFSRSCVLWGVGSVLAGAFVSLLSDPDTWQSATGLTLMFVGAITGLLAAVPWLAQRVAVVGSHRKSPRRSKWTAPPQHSELVLIAGTQIRVWALSARQRNVLYRADGPIIRELVLAAVPTLDRVALLSMQPDDVRALATAAERLAQGRIDG